MFAPRTGSPVPSLSLKPTEGDSACAWPLGVATALPEPREVSELRLEELRIKLFDDLWGSIDASAKGDTYGMGVGECGGENAPNFIVMLLPA
jgi:hypothetical protein